VVLPPSLVPTLAEFSAKLPELEYVLLNFTTLANQLARYKLVERDVSTYAQSAAGATTFVPPIMWVCQYVQHDVLFEEFNNAL